MTADWEQAARRGDLDTLRQLLAGGADIDARDAHGQTALMVAARHNHPAAVALLAGHGADLDHTAKFHLTALMIAVINGHVAIVRTLVSAGADRSVRGSGAPGFHGKTALDLAIAAGQAEVIALLRGAGSPS